VQYGETGGGRGGCRGKGGRRSVDRKLLKDIMAMLLKLPNRNLAEGRSGSLVLTWGMKGKRI
jgi:hypothetical protein